MQPRVAVFTLAPAILFSFASTIGFAQQNLVQPRITRPIDESKLIALHGNTYPLAKPASDLGPARQDLQLDRMLLVLQRSPQQEASLQSLLDQQQDRASPNYHAWLTPDQFGQRFGISDQDIQTIASWLASHGFRVNRVGRGRGVIEFSGTAAQVLEAFHTEIHQYRVKAADHWANATDPQIPSALAPVVAGIVSLHNFPRRPLHRSWTTGVDIGTDGHGWLSTVSRSNPLLTIGQGCGLSGGICAIVTPYDFATIYNVLPLWNASSAIDGAGQTIAIVGQSDIYARDFSDFRAIYGLPPATLNIIYDGPNPGPLAFQGDELESDLDVEWAGAVAKGATIDLVVSASTNSTAGVDLSAEYIVDNDIAPILSESYGACEPYLGAAGNQFHNQLWQQAAAEGISVFVAAGDSGSAACDQNSGIATNGLSVNGLSSTPYNVAVGGTDFDYSNGAASNYWNTANDPNTHASAKSYIPEMTWNDSCTNAEFFPFTGAADAEGDCNDANSKYFPYFDAPVAGSGGASNCTSSSNQSPVTCTGGYAKPSWQSGTGVPNDGKRDVPDVSLFAADGLNGSAYIVCETAIYGGCPAGQLSPPGIGVGGTSASTPALAGIMALINQKTQSRQGNANYVFYALAARPGATCASNGNVASTCIFYDVANGTIAMPCLSGSTSCVTKTAGDQVGVLPGYNATAGYDLTTGLGTVNVANLVNNWSSVSFQPTVSTLSLQPTAQIVHGSPVGVNIIVAPKSGSGTPSGQVSLTTSLGRAAGMFTLTSGSVSGTTGLLPGGNYTVRAHYAGDGIYAASDSTPGVPVTVVPEQSVTTVQAFTLDQYWNATPFSSGPYGTVVYLRASVAGQSGQGVPSGTVSFAQTVNGATTNLAGGPFPLNSEGYTMTPLPGNYVFFTPGTYAITAAYGGDSSFNHSGSAPLNFTVTKAATTTTLGSNPCTFVTGLCVVPSGAFVSIWFSVLDNILLPGASQPTGTITLYSNGSSLTAPIPLNSGAWSTTQLPLGLDQITAQYSGDSNFAASTSPSATIDVGGNFAVTATPATVNIASPGKSGSTTLTFTSQNGLSGSTNLPPATCFNPPPQSTCSFSPSTVTLDGSATPVSVTLTISTTAPSSATHSASLREVHGSRIALMLGLSCLGLALIGARKSQRHTLGFRAISILLMTALVSCGGGSGTNRGAGTGAGGGATGGGGNSGTPVGTYTGIGVNIEISGIAQSVNLNVNVQ